MSRSKLHLIVEGRQTDSYLYGKICRTLSPSRFDYHLIRSDELPTQGSGKPHLLNYFDTMRRSGNLQIDFKNHKATVAFIVDKDVDDWHRTKKRSKHLIYTRSYDIENYVFRHGDLIEAISAACSEDPARVEVHFLDAQRWHALAADRWRDWVKLCLVASLLKIRGVCNYKAGSQVNLGFSGQADKVKVEAKLAELQKLSGLAESEFNAAYSKISKRVDRLFSLDRHDEIFKGKWYKLQLQEEVNSLVVTQGKVSALGERLLTHMMQSMRFDGSWADDFTIPLKKLLAEVEAT
jgi:hypothetical protein